MRGAVVLLRGVRETVQELRDEKRRVVAADAPHAPGREDHAAVQQERAPIRLRDGHRARVHAQGSARGGERVERGR